MSKSLEYLEEKYRQLYGGKNCEAKIKTLQRHQKLKYFIVAIVFICAFVLNTGEQVQLQKLMESGSQGRLTALHRPKEGTSPASFQIKVLADTKQGEIEKILQITVESINSNKGSDGEATQEGQESYGDKVEREIESAVSEANQNTAGAKVVLPVKLENGESLKWEQVNSWNPAPYLGGLLLVLFLLYKGRFQSIKAEETNAKASVIRELPDFTNKLILLLNAGVVLNTALGKIISDWKNVSGNYNYFYDQMNDIFKSVSETNSAVHEELKQFAKRTGVRELMRVSNIISDNVYKGTDLIDKLQKENQLLWFSRKQQSEEKGRLAETKLTMPLVILLLVLVLITIAPALMGM